MRHQHWPWKIAVCLGTLASTLAIAPSGRSADSPLCLRKPHPSQSFLEAVYDALTPQDCERWPHLTPIRPDNPTLIWQQDRVLMVAWAPTCTEASPPTALSCLEEGETYTVPDGDAYALWVTAAPEVRSFIWQERAYNPAFSPETLVSRLEQYLGLKPQGRDRTFVEMWVHPDDLIRPCLDEDPTDTQCDLWRWADLDPASSFALALGRGPFQDRYPFTGLGYTYDWGNSRTDVGASEFVVRHGATATIHRKVSTHTYGETPLLP